jgi:hypothetical protein
MAKPIKETPILKGNDAKRFIEQASIKRDRNVVNAEKERILKNYNFFRQAETIVEYTQS